jgi:hypothetical protein
MVYSALCVQKDEIYVPPAPHPLLHCCLLWLVLNGILSSMHSEAGNLCATRRVTEGVTEIKGVQVGFRGKMIGNEMRVSTVFTKR